MEAVIYNNSPAGRRLAKIFGNFDGGAYLGRYSHIRLEEINEPEPRGPHWVKIKTTMSAVSRGDISLISHKRSHTRPAFPEFPFVLGCESHGIVIETGDAVRGFRQGDRVIVDPALNCRTRDIEPVCESCESGNTSSCRNTAQGSISPGVSIGCCPETGGGWSRVFIAHESQLHRLPPDMDDDSALALHSLGAAVHTVMRNFPDDRTTILLYGCGAAGLGIIAAIRALGSSCRIVAVESSRFHGETALQYGADRIIYPRELKRPITREAADITGAQCHKSSDGEEFLTGGFDIIFDTTASPLTINEGLRLAANGASIVLAGASRQGAVDTAPITFKNVHITGSCGCGIETYRGRRTHSIPIAIDIAAKHGLNLKSFVTHKFRINDYRKAIEVSLHKAKYNAITTAFAF